MIEIIFVDKKGRSRVYVNFLLAKVGISKVEQDPRHSGSLLVLLSINTKRLPGGTKHWGDDGQNFSLRWTCVGPTYIIIVYKKQKGEGSVLSCNSVIMYCCVNINFETTSTTIFKISDIWS